MAKLTQILLDAYRVGVFPMAESADTDAFAFYRPYMRGILPIENIHIPRKLLKTLRGGRYSVTINTAFTAIIDGCAIATDKRSKTWINRPIRDVFIQLHEEGHAHSIETRDADGVLAGGLYGLAIGSVFCGESMVSFQPGASKIALVHLCAALWKCGFTVLDTQFVNPHLLQFGAYEILQEDYEEMIRVEMKRPALPLDRIAPGAALLDKFLSRRAM